MTVLHIGAKDFENEVLKSDKTVLLDFFATWCGPCRMLAPILDELAAERPDVKVVKVDVDEESELAARYGVMSIPTLFVIKNGEVTAQAMGAQPKAKLLAMLD
ncbi:MAG: thioredoxin [Ruminococcaceae bacterium]|nr:thioredoxin [Oscillospiraceae bacterium]